MSLFWPFSWVVQCNAPFLPWDTISGKQTFIWFNAEIGFAVFLLKGQDGGGCLFF